MVKTRFCPSPTGIMHLGNARTALFSALFAKHEKGEFLLRIEDTDLKRSNPRYSKMLMDDLRWLGVEWQEGPEHDRGNGPYLQSLRNEIYESYFTKLQKDNFAYLCFCSEEQLALTRKVQLASGKPPRYPGTCRNLSKEEIAKKLNSNCKPVLRFRVSSNESIEFDDLVKGMQRILSDNIGDFIIKRTNGSAAFMFCNAVDDSLMGVTHVIRGDDHLTNTPRQMMILKALGLPIPIYGHISMIVGDNGSPLSKRSGSSSVADLRELGYLNIAICNYLSRLGHVYPENKLMNFNELSGKFDVNSLSKSPAKFDFFQLRFWQKQALSQISTNDVFEWMGDQVKVIVPNNLRELFVQTVIPNILFQSDALKWAQIFFQDLPPFSSQEKTIFKTAGSDYFKLIIEMFQSGCKFNEILKQLKSELNVKGKSLFLPMRIALTSQANGPELADIFKLLDKNIIAKRLDSVLELIC